jgi:invasion protein IalB
MRVGIAKEINQGYRSMFPGNGFAKSGVRAFVAIAALGAISVTAVAQDAPAPVAPTAPGAAAAPPAASQSRWLKVCNTDPKTNTEICVINQELRAETGQPIAAVTIQSTAQEGKYGIGLVVPIGFILPPGIALTVDGEKKGEAQYTICLPPSARQAAVCIAQASVAEDFIAALKKGNELALVVMSPQQNKPIPIRVTLSGFSKTFDGPGVDRAAAEAEREQLSEALQKSAEEARRKLIEQQQKEMGNAPN